MALWTQGAGYIVTEVNDPSKNGKGGGGGGGGRYRKREREREREGEILNKTLRHIDKKNLRER